MILIIDNYDSFTFNLVQALGALGAEILVYRNDKVELDEVDKLDFDKLIISPGPCTPEVAGISSKLIKLYTGRVPILGVCLGHQAIGYTFGSKIVRAKVPVHGKTDTICHDGKGVYKGLSNPLIATRYHSLIVDETTIPEQFEAVSHTEKDGVLMGIRHREFPVEGVQFHPESFLTSEGDKLLSNFLELR